MTLPDSISRTRWSAVATFAVATLIVASELSLTGLALPAIGAEFGVSPGTAGWVVTAYTLPLAALAIPAGRWVDRADLRSVFTLALAAVGLASVLAAVMPSFWGLLAARVVQGVASAVYLAVYLPVVAGAVREEQRGRAMSAIATIMMVGSMAVAPLGGLVAAEWGWRAVLVVKVPLLVPVILLGWRTIPASSQTGTRLPRPDRSLWVEALLLGGAVTAALVLLDQTGHWQIAAPAALLCVVLGVAWARLSSSAEVIALVRRPVLGLSQLALLLVAAMIGLITFLLPFFLADIAGRGPAVLGVAILWFTAAAALLAPVAGVLTDKLGPIPVAVAGAALSVLGLLSMLSLGPGSSVVDLSWRLAVIGAGGALTNSPIMTAILAATAVGAAGTAGGLTNVARTLGNTLGPAAVAVAWNLGGGGATGFATGIWVLAGFTAAALGALLAARFANARSRMQPGSDRPRDLESEGPRPVN